MHKKKKRESLNLEESKIPYPPFNDTVQAQLEQRARERYLIQLSERERTERLAALNERERRASLDHEARLASERQRLSIIHEKEKRRTSLATEPLEEARLQDEAAGRTRRNTIVLPRKGRKRSSLKRGRRRSRKKPQRRSSLSPERNADVKEEATTSQEKPKRKSNEKPLQISANTREEDMELNSDSDSDSVYELEIIEPPHPFKDIRSLKNTKARRPSPPAVPQYLDNPKPTDLEVESRDQVKDGNRRKGSTDQRKVSVQKETEVLTRNKDLASITKEQRDIDKIAKVSIPNEEAKTTARELNQARIDEINRRLWEEKRDREQKRLSRHISSAIPPGASSGLKLFNNVENVFLQHKKFVGEGDGCLPTKVNVYQFVNIHGLKLLRVIEESIESSCCGLFRKIVYSCYDEDNVQVGAIIRSPVVCSRTKRRLKVYSPPEHLLGFVEQKCTFGEPKIDITDHEGFVYAGIRLEPYECLCCTTHICWGCRKNKTFSIKTLRGSPRGRIRDDWDEQPFTHCGVHFPNEMNIVVKLLIMAATILVYDQFFKQRSIPLHKDPRENMKHEPARSISEETMGDSEHGEQ